MPSAQSTILGGSRLNGISAMPSVTAPQSSVTPPSASAGLLSVLGRGGGIPPERVATPQSELLQPVEARINPALLAALASKNVFMDTFVPRFAGPQTMTKLAQSAIGIIDQMTKDTLSLALNTIVNKGIAPKDLLDSLEQGVKFNEVMSELARGWSQATKDNFVKYFGLPSAQLEVMDTIVSLAVLNDPTLEGQLRRENTPQPTPEDLLDGRRILYQYPPPGSVLEPPYVILLAVEHIDTQPAQNVVDAIMMELDDYRVREYTFKVTRSAFQKLQ